MAIGNSDRSYLRKRKRRAGQDLALLINDGLGNRNL